MKRVVARLGFLLGLAAPAPAADGPAPTVPGDSISAAKREFDSLKALREPALPTSAKGTLPNLQVPELHATPPDATRRAKQKQAEAAAKARKSGTGNWLVDAMERDARATGGNRGAASGVSGRRTRDGRSDGASEDLLETDAEGRPLSATDDAASGVAAAHDQRRSERESVDERPNVVNPLTQFLGSWMTPQDYALLRPGLDDSARRNDGAAGIGGGAGGGGLPGGESTAQLALLDARSDSPATAPARENPFLQALELPAAPTGPMLPAPAPAFAPTEISAAPAAPPLLPAAAVTPPPPPRSTVPDFAKPALEEKYFKQLKRF
jgi:hypothetical protein